MNDQMTTAEKATDCGTNICITLMVEINEARSKIFLETNKMRAKMDELAKFKESLREVKVKSPHCFPNLW